ncbi:MAG: M81 family metallopeptidase [Bacillota bacterium]
MRIGVASFSHETCTFCPDPTTIERLEPGARRGRDVLDSTRGIPSYINGFIEAAEAERAELVPILAVGMAPGPYTSWLDTECFDKYAGEIAQGLAEAGDLDGVLLALHGAMAVRDVLKPEAEIVRRVRGAVGEVPIMVTLDLHANEDRELTDASDAVFVIKTYPHIDSEETGMIAARAMIETIRGEFIPTQALRKPGIVSASIYQASGYHPMKVLYDRCREWEERDEVRCVSVAPGYAYADVPDIGMSVIAVTHDDLSLAEEIAGDISRRAWELKEALNRPLPRPREGVAEVMRMVSEGTRPVVIADGADRTGDSTHMLAELLRQGAENFAIPGISDPETARDLESASREGDEVTVTVGGWASEYSGDPVQISGVIEYMGRPCYTLVGPMRKGARVQDGFVARLNLGRNRHVVISDRMRGSNDSSGLTSVGVDIDSLDIIVLKSRVHHRAFWDQVGAIDFPVDAPGLGPADLTTLTYENVPDDVYPIGAKYRQK